MITEIFSVAPGDAQPPRLFSDATSPVMLAFWPHEVDTAVPFQTAVVGNHLLAPGKERGSSSGPQPTGIYEFFLDGSGKYRKILDLPSGERVDLLVASGDGAKLAFLSLAATSLTLFIHDVKTDMLKIARSVTVRNAGWFPDNKTIFFIVEPGPEDDLDLANDCKCMGTWLMKEDGTGLRHLPLSFGVLHENGYGPWSDVPPTMLGVVGGQYLFSVMMDDRISRPHTASSFLALSDPRTGKAVKVPLQHHLVLSQFGPSPSGQYIAYVQQNPRELVGNKFIVTPEHVWIQPTPAGDPKEVFSLETGQERGTYLTLVGWMSE